MRTRLVVLVLLVLVMASMVSSSASARSLGEIIIGSDAKGNQPPFNELDISLFYTNGEPCYWPEPMVYHMQERDGSISSIIPDLSMPVPVCDRPVMAIISGIVMTGGKIGRIVPTADSPIKTIVDSFDGRGDMGDWLLASIYQARAKSELTTGRPLNLQELTRLAARQARRQSRNGMDSGDFPPFICLPPESGPEACGDGSIRLKNPPLGALKILICVYVTNRIVGLTQTVSLFVPIGKNYAGAVVAFKTARPDTFMAPNPEITRARTPAAEPPLAREHVLSVAPPAAPLVQAGELPNISSYNTAPPPVAQAPNYSNNAVPWQIEKWLYGFYGCTRNQRWDVPCVFPMPMNEDHGTGSLLIYGIKQDGTLFDEGVATILINGQLQGNTSRCWPLMPNDGRAGVKKDAMAYMYVQGGASYHVEVHAYANGKMNNTVLGSLDGVTGPAGTITTAPVHLGY